MPLLEQQKIEIKEFLMEKIRNKLATYNPETSAMPFHFRLIGRDRMALFSFIHSVNTMLGTSIFEQIGKMIVAPRAKRAIGQYKEFTGFIGSEAILTIEHIMRDLRSATRTPNKEKETREILAIARQGEMGKRMKKRIDLFVEIEETANIVEYYFELKTAKPNINEFTEIKRQLLEWVAMRGSENPPEVKVKTIVAIPYNPYEPKPYERWTLQGLFDLQKEVLVGAEFWNFLGGVGAYEDLLAVFGAAGEELYDEIGSKMKSL